MDYKLTKYETETTITYNDAEDNATIYTCNKSLMRKLDKYCSKSGQIILIKSDEVSRTYKYPKKLLSFRFPKELSDEKREELILRGKALAEKMRAANESNM